MKAKAIEVKPTIDGEKPRLQSRLPDRPFRRICPLLDKKRFGYYRPTTSSQTQGEALVDRMGYRLWGGCRCPIRGVRVSHRHLPTPVSDLHFLIRRLFLHERHELVEVL